MFDLRQLTYFLAVADAGSFTGAARHCRVSQPTLSQQIRTLEEEFGEPLFHRRPRNVELTEAGHIAYPLAREAVTCATTLGDTFRRRHERVEGTVSLGIIPTIAPYLIPNSLPRFLADHPRVSVEVKEAQTSVLLGMVVRSEVDVGVASDIDRDSRRQWAVHVRDLMNERLLLALPDDHALAVRKRPPVPGDVPPKEMILLSEGHCLSGQMLKACKTRRGSTRLVCDQLESLLAMVGSGLGLGVVPEMAVRNRSIEGVVFRRFASPEPVRRISILLRRNHALNPVAHALLDYLGPGRQDLAETL
jgi:LysR family hydrogen peroxide-inducible transcriptional activator